MQALTHPHCNIYGHQWISLVSHVYNTS